MNTCEKIPETEESRKSSSLQNTSTCKKPCTTGTTSCQAGKTKVATHKEEVPRRELEKLDSLRSKLEQSVDSFIKARKELEEILTAEGSSEQASFLSGSSPDLKTELKRH